MEPGSTGKRRLLIRHTTHYHYDVPISAAAFMRLASAAFDGSAAVGRARQRSGHHARSLRRLCTKMSSGTWPRPLRSKRPTAS